MFSERLRKLRKEKGVTQEELAKIIKVERSSIGKYEGKGGVIPSDDVKQRIADYFDVSIDYLLGRSDIRNNRDFATAITGDRLSADETELLGLFRSMNDRGRVLTLESARSFAGNPAMQKENREASAM